MKKLCRLKYKKISQKRKRPENYIPLGTYCYGLSKLRGHIEYCEFLLDEQLNSFIKNYRDKKINKNEAIMEEISAKCSLDGHWVFDYCKHCDIND